MLESSNENKNKCGPRKQVQNAASYRGEPVGLGSPCLPLTDADVRKFRTKLFSPIEVPSHPHRKPLGTVKPGLHVPAPHS